MSTLRTSPAARLRAGGSARSRVPGVPDLGRRGGAETVKRLRICSAKMPSPFMRAPQVLSYSFPPRSRRTRSITRLSSSTRGRRATAGKYPSPHAAAAAPRSRRFSPGRRRGREDGGHLVLGETGNDGATSRRRGCRPPPAAGWLAGGAGAVRPAARACRRARRRGGHGDVHRRALPAAELGEEIAVARHEEFLVMTATGLRNSAHTSRQPRVTRNWRSLAGSSRSPRSS